MARVAALVVLGLSTAAWGAPPILTFDEVRAGMRGTGRTVFAGTVVTSFDVEILGKLPDIGPGQNMILARCSGGPLAETGVLAGMSGSPVSIDGRLVGAVAYSWGFAKDAIAGITPIEEMLALTETPADGRRAWAGPADRDRLTSLALPPELSDFFRRRVAALVPNSAALQPIPLPLAISGVGAAALRAVEPQLSGAGFLPLQVGGGGKVHGPAPRPEPGSAIGLKLVRGDIEMTATGTVTWIEGDQLLAFGHPLFGLGRIDLPLTAASVEALLPSLAQSAKIATPLGELGAVRQDRAAGLLARLGATPSMIPVRLTLRGADGRESRFAFDVAADPLLAPLLLYVSVNGILATRERLVGSVTVRLAEGSVIQIIDGDDVAVDNVFTGPTATLYGTGIAAYILHLLLNNVWTPPRVEGVNLILEYDTEPRVAQLRRASLSRYRARPGDAVLASVVLKPYRGPDIVLTREVTIPDDQPPGVVTLLVGGAEAASTADEDRELPLPENLEQLVRLINQLRRNDQVYLLGVAEDSGVLLGGARLPGLPPSASRVLTRPRSRGNHVVVSRRGVLEEALSTDYAIEGFARLELEVLAP